MQTTKAIFGDAGTGFVESGQKGSEGDIKVLEVLKSFLPGSQAR